MSLDEINNMANELLKNFVNCLGLDGNYYVSVTKTPIMFGNTFFNGRFLTARSGELKEYIAKNITDEKMKNYIYNEGLIVINKKYKKEPLDFDFITTLIHEKIHSNRMLLINSQHGYDNGVKGVFYDDGRFVQNTDSSKPYFADAAQDILNASIDNSRKTINKYASISDEERDDISFHDSEFDRKMEKQEKIDEALVETMAIISYYLYFRNTDNIFQVIKEINKRYDGDDIKAITNIILRHNDLELFKWMIDPLSYQVDDVNYDFISRYSTNDDLDDLNIIYESNECSFDDYFLDNNSRTRNK